MEVCLDRFSHDYRPAPRPLEPKHCPWCGEQVHGERDMHERCEWEQDIERAPFGEVFNMIMDKVESCEAESNGRLEFWCYFKDMADALQVIEILEARRATYSATKDWVRFEVGAEANWRLEFK